MTDCSVAVMSWRQGYDAKDIWCVLMDNDERGNPIEGINGQLFMHPENSEPVEQESFFGDLPDSIVETEIWPRLMRGDNDVENFMICTSLRGVCTAWYNFVEDQREWFKGMTAFNLYQVHRDYGTSSDDDSDQ